MSIIRSKHIAHTPDDTEADHEDDNVSGPRGQHEASGRHHPTGEADRPTAEPPHETSNERTCG